MSDIDTAYAKGVTDTLGLVRQVAAIDPAALSFTPDRVPTMARLADAVSRADPRALRVLRPYTPAEAVTPKQAADMAGRSESSVRAWVDRYAIGRLVVGSLMVSRPALAMLLDDDPLALAAYLSGDRAGSLVALYFERLGLT